MALPNTYKQVEYIQSSGTQYITTSIIPSDTKGIYIKISSQNVTNDLLYIGSRKTTDTRFRIGNSYDSSISSGRIYIGWNTNHYYTMSANTIYEVELNYLNSRSKKVNGTSVAGSIGTLSSSNNIPITIFAGNEDGTIITPSSIKLYSCKISDGSNIINDFVPVIRKSDNKPGLYDLVNDVFYTNAGTGEFSYPAQFGKITHIYLSTNSIRPSKVSGDYYYSDDNWDEYQSLVSSVGSVQLVDTGKRYRFNNACYIGNRVAVNVNGTTFSKVNLDTLTVISSKSSAINGKIWYFGDNRILTRSGIMDFDGNMVTSFGVDYRMITPGLPGEIWANDNSYNMYKGIVNGDNVTFTKVGTSTSNSGIGASPGDLTYGRLGTYSLGATENSTHYVGFSNASTGTFSTITASMGSQHASGWGVCMADGKIYKHTLRTLCRGRLYKIGTSGEGAVGNSLGTSWTSYGTRAGKFLGNIISGGMGSQNGTGNGYGSNSYFISTSGTVTLAQSNALAYDTNIYTTGGFVDENGWLYPATSLGGSGVILKTDKTFTDFHWWNPYLWR